MRPVMLLMIGIFFLLQGCDDNPVDKGDAVYAVEVNEPVRVLEGRDLVFTITRSVDLSQESMVSYNLTGEATYGEDYTDPNDRSVSFSAGQSSVEVRLETIVDQEPEEEESVILTLVNATDGEIDPNFREATGYIRDGSGTCVGPAGNVLFVDFDDITTDNPYDTGAGDATRLWDGYQGFIWGDWWARDDRFRSQDEGREPLYGWFDGIVSPPNAIYPSWGAQPGSISVIARNEPFALKSFYMSALGINDPLPVTLLYRDFGGGIFGQETFTVSRGEKAFIEPDMDIMFLHCLRAISFTQPVLGASFIIDDMTFIH